MKASIALGVASAALLIACTLGALRVGVLSEHEIDVIDRSTLRQAAERQGATPESAPLLTVHLEREQRVEFDLCADDPMQPPRWAGTMAIAIWRPSAQELMHRTELDAQTLGLARRQRQQACLQIGHGEIAESDDYQIEALYDSAPPAIADVPLYARVTAYRDLSRLDAVLVVGAWLGSLGIVLALLFWRPRPGEPTGDLALELELGAPRRRVAPELRAVLGLVTVLGAFFASSWLPGGAILGFVVALGLAGIEIAVAVGLAPRGERRRVIGLERTRGLAWQLPLAIVGGVLLGILARYSTMLVPSTSQSAIEAFVSWPSGMLSFALLGVTAPLAEEIFFRGFLFGVLRERSRVLAFLGGWLLFVLAHVPQTFGQWGALVSIAVMGLGLTSMRALSGNTLVPALAHLTYNGLIAVVSVLE